MLASAHHDGGAFAGYDPIFELDAGNFASYPESGSEWTDVVGGKVITLIDGPRWRAEEAGGAMIFGNSYTTRGDGVAAADDLDISGPITLEVWVRPMTTQEGAFIERGYFTGSGGYMLWWISGELRLYVRTASRVATTLTIGIWQHVVATLDGTNAKIYVNGAEAASAAYADYPASVGSEDVWISSYPTAQNAENRMGVARIYDKALTAGEVADIYDAERARYETPVAHPDDYFRESRVLTANATVYTFPAVEFGPAAANRRVVVAVGSRTSSTPTVTIGGVSATVDTSDLSPNQIYLASAVVPSGISGDVVVTFPAGVLRCSLGVWAIPEGATFIDGSQGANAVDFAVDTAVGDIIIAASYENGGAGLSTATWTGVTERYDELVESDMTHAGGDAVAVSSPTTTLNVTFTTTTGAGVVAGSYRPL